jgi:hypothetical protein
MQVVEEEELVVVQWEELEDQEVVEQVKKDLDQLTQVVQLIQVEVEVEYLLVILVLEPAVQV